MEVRIVQKYHSRPSGAAALLVTQELSFACFARPVRHGWVHKVVLCNDKEVTQTMVDHTMAHELVHAYDQCRIKLDPTNCLHVACTEVSIAFTAVQLCSYEC